MFVDLVLTLAGGLSALLIFLYYWRKGQFDDMEDVKYQMFRDDEEGIQDSGFRNQEGDLRIDKSHDEKAVKKHRSSTEF